LFFVLCITWKGRLLEVTLCVERDVKPLVIHSLTFTLRQLEDFIFGVVCFVS